MQIIIFVLLFMSPHGNLRPVVHSQNEESKDSTDSSDRSDSTVSSDSSESTAKPEDEDETDGPVKAEIGPGFIHDKNEEDSTSTEKKEESEKKPATICPLIKVVFTLGLACS